MRDTSRRAKALDTLETEAADAAQLAALQPAVAWDDPAYDPVTIVAEIKSLLGTEIPDVKRAQRRRAYVPLCRGLFNNRESGTDADQFRKLCKKGYERAADFHQSFGGFAKVGTQPLRQSSVTIAYKPKGKSKPKSKGGSIRKSQPRTQRLRVYPVRYNSATVHLVYLDGYWHLFSMASAAKSGQDGYNDFATIWLAIIEVLRPATLFVDRVDRQWRDRVEVRRAIFHLTGRVQRVIEGGSRHYPLVGPDADQGFQDLQNAGADAADDRDRRVQMLIEGRLDDIVDGEWFWNNRFPDGYRVNKKGRLKLDCRSSDDPFRQAKLEEQWQETRKRVASMLAILGTDQMATKKARLCDDAGALPVQTSQGGRQPFLARGCPAEAVNAYYRLASLYIHGEVLLRFNVSLEHKKRLAGLEVVRLPGGDDDGEVQVLIRCPIPPGGWASPEVLAAFERQAKLHRPKWRDRRQQIPWRPLSKRVRKATKDPRLLGPHTASGALLPAVPASKGSKRGPGAHLILPLTGVNWADSEAYFELRVENSTTYRLLRWPLGSVQDSTSKGPLLPGTHFPTLKAGLYRPADSLITHDSLDCQQVGQFSTAAVQGGMVSALVEALRDGIAVANLPAAETFLPHGSQAAESRGLRAAERIKEARRLTRRANAAAEMALDQTDVDQRRHYNDRSLALRREAELTREQADELRMPMPTAGPATKPFDVLGDVWLPALATVGRSSRQISIDTAGDMACVLSGFRMYRDGWMWKGEVSLVLNTSEGVSRLGPINWTIGPTNHGRAAGALAITPRSSHSSLGRVEMEARLIQAGVQESAAVELASATFPELPMLVLNALTGFPLPKSIAPDWLNRRYVDWLVRVYTGDTAWKFGSVANGWLTTHALRQYVASYVAQHGRTPAKTFAPLHIGRTPAVRECASIWQHRTGTGRVWHPVVSLSNIRDQAVCEPIVCSCGRAADVVALTPDIPRGLHCECGLVPDAELFGADPLMRLPSALRQLRIPLDHCRQDIESRLTRRVEQGLGGKKRAVMVCSDLLEAGATIAAFNARLGGDCRLPMRELEALGFVQASGVTKPYDWCYTSRGREWAVAQLPSGPEPVQRSAH